MSGKLSKWHDHGIHIVHQDQHEATPPRWPGVELQGAITAASVHANKIWAGTIHIHPDARTGPHHHGELESVIYVVSGKARMRWGDQLEYYAEAGPGDFIYVPPFVPHQEINASPDNPLVCVLVRSNQEPVMVVLPIEGVDQPEAVAWVDPHHPPR